MVYVPFCRHTQIKKRTATMTASKSSIKEEETLHLLNIKLSVRYGRSEGPFGDLYLEHNITFDPNNPDKIHDCFYRKTPIFLTMDIKFLFKHGQKDDNFKHYIGDDIDVYGAKLKEIFFDFYRFAEEQLNHYGYGKSGLVPDRESPRHEELTNILKKFKEITNMDTRVYQVDYISFINMAYLL